MTIGTKTTSIDDARAFLEKHNIDTVRVGAVDLDGLWRGKQFGAEYFLNSVAANGTHIANVLFGWDVEDEVVEGLAYTNWDTGYPDIKLIPDLSSLRLIPWEPRVASVICEMVEMDMTPVIYSPRDILRKAVEKANSMGYQPKAAYEFEFYLFEGNIADIAENDYRGLRAARRAGHCYSMLHYATSDDLFGQLRRHIQEAGLTIEATISEHGPGQFEFNLKYDDALAAADGAMYAKYAVKELAAKNGLTACFMAKPNANWSGSSGHMHMSLSDLDGNPLFSNSEDPLMLSEIGLSFLAGMKEHSRIMSAIYQPNVNSYKRTMNVGAWAAANSSWGIDNRTVSFRAIPSKGPAARIENRIPGADTNPYLVIAASLLCGLKGIETGMDAGQPFKGNAYRATPEQATPLASSLEEAARLFADSPLVKELFGEDFVDHYVRMKRWELLRMNSKVTDWELNRYLEVI
tara:strand:- start:4944 stop:6329 length:1386 start_codon:yes stop_codon:yes gene_type:complete